jgi:PAS domain S-box-containing protein
LETNQNNKKLIPLTLDEKILVLLDSLNIGFLHMDMEFGILEVNEKIIEWYGGTREEIVGHNCREFFLPEDFSRLMAMDQVFLQKGADHYQYEFYLPNNRGETIPFLLSQSVNRDASGIPVSTNVLLTDISDQKRMQEELSTSNRALADSQEALENEKKIIEAILFGIGDCVTIFDQEGILLLSNPMGKEIRGNRTNPLLDLNAGVERISNFEIAGERRQFIGRVEVIHDNLGRVKAYAEILKEITDQIKLEERENELLLIKRGMRRSEIESKMIGISPATQKVFDLILRCAEVDSSIIIFGETGVGKELAARAIHAQSKRRGRPFVPVNCGSIPEALLESELFGHEKGAFTGAIASRIGLFREAEGGTLFLDEVGDLNVALQAKILRTIQEREVRPVGGNRAHPIDVRILSATNRDLLDLISRGLFREDLYYRIAVIPVTIPPLRERREDILYIAEHFIQKHCERNGATRKWLDADSRQLLLGHRWPGNIRELENSIEYAIAMSRGSLIKSEDFPLQVVASQTPPLHIGISPESVPRVELYETQPSDQATTVPLRSWELEERRVIAETLAKFRGNRISAARELAMSRSTLWRKITMYHLR